jgi:hypothetical protein
MSTRKMTQLLRDLAKSEHVTEDTLMREALKALLREKKRVIRIDQFEILKRHGASTTTDLDDKIHEGTLPESPMWEDRITLDNLEEAIRHIDRALATL